MWDLGQGCILSPTLCNLYLKRIKIDELNNYGFDGGISCGGLKITNLQFAGDIDSLGESRPELQEVTDGLNSTSRRYSIEINREV